MNTNLSPQLHKISKRYFFLILSLIFSSSIVAKEDDVLAIARLSFEEFIKVTIATKTDKRLVTAPSSISVFTAKEISSMGIKSVQELLNFVPGFQSTRESRVNQGYMVSARGASTPQASYNILFMLDGHRLNDEATGGALIINRYLTTANIKQVEVIRGPGSALYGTSAFSGVVNIITKDKPGKNKNHQFYFAGGNLNSHEFHGQVSKQEKDWGFSLFGRYYDDNGQNYDDISGASADKIEKDQEIYAKLRWQDLHLNLRYSEEELKGFLNTGERDVENIQQESVNLKYDAIKADNWNLTFRGNFRHIRQSTSNSHDQRLITIRENAFDIGFDNRYKFSENHILLAGIEWRYAAVNSNIITKSKRDILGVYIQDQYEFTDNLELTLGLRYDNYSDNSDTINPRFALVYTTDFDAIFKIMYGQAFRAPSIRQIAQSDGLGNSNLLAEEVKTLEFAWLQSFGHNYHTSLTYFHNWSKNKIDTVFRRNELLGGSDRQFANIDGTLKSSGLEFELQAKITDEFLLRSAYTYLLSSEENPRRVAKNMLSLIATYKYNDVNINLNGYYHSEMEQETSSQVVELDSYWLLNANVRYQMTDWLTIVGQGHNLLDAGYFSSTKLANIPNGIPNRGRTYSVGFEVAF